MQLEISDEERGILGEILDQDYRNLKEEIYHTETMVYKEPLKRREAAILSMLRKLGRDPGTVAAA